jgi:hypothetical protein
MRKAVDKNILRQIFGTYINSGFAQDSMETLAGAALAAGGQALFTDMTPEEIAISTGLGIAGATALRPAMGQVGYAVGRPLDRAFPKAADNMTGLARVIPGTPQSLEFYKGNEITEGLARAKYNQNFKLKDGGERGFLEGTTGLIGRQYGDNVAQLGVAVGTPMLFDNIKGDERQLEEIAELETALAKLKGGV